MLNRDRGFLKEVQRYNLDDLELTNIFVDPDAKKMQSYNHSRNAAVPIVIDYGSQTTKAGWGNMENPCLVFRSVISKNKDLKAGSGSLYVGNKLKDFDYSKNNYKSPYEKNVIQHFGLLENINDYIFSELGIKDSKINRPLVVSECIANPDFSRSKTLEQFFECYQAPSILMGADALFGFHYNFSGVDKPTCLLVSLGNTTIHVIPIINGEVIKQDIKRINVGGGSIFDILYKNLNLKYPSYKTKLTQNYIQAIMESMSFVASNYEEQLKYFQHGKGIFYNAAYRNHVQFENNTITQQEMAQMLREPAIIEFPVAELPQISEEDVMKKKELRKEQAVRLKETMARRKEEKVVQQREEVDDLQKAFDDIVEDPSRTEQILATLDYSSFDELKKRLKKLKIKLGLVTKEDLEEQKFNLLNIPDDQLTPEQQRSKKYQVMQKQAAITRQLKKEYENKQKEQINKLKEDNPDKYISDLYEKRRALITRIDDKKKSQLDLTSSRFSRFNQKIQQYDPDSKLDEEFLAVEGDTKAKPKKPVVEEENLEQQLAECEAELENLDPIFSKTKAFEPQLETRELFPQDAPELELNSDLIKGPEVLLQPSIVGVDQPGLSETILFVISRYDEATQRALFGNICLIGGCAFMKNLPERIKLDLQADNKLGTPINVKIVKDPIFDTWKGMQQVSRDSNIMSQYSMTKAEYEEYGSHYIKENPFRV